jgi:hypothetical protein
VSDRSYPKSVLDTIGPHQVERPFLVEADRQIAAPLRDIGWGSGRLAKFLAFDHQADRVRSAAAD